MVYYIRQASIKETFVQSNSWLSMIWLFFSLMLTIYDSTVGHIDFCSVLVFILTESQTLAFTLALTLALFLVLIYATVLTLALIPALTLNLAIVLTLTLVFILYFFGF